MVDPSLEPMVALFTGRLRVKGFTKMGKMRKLFSEPGPDDPFSFPG